MKSITTIPQDVYKLFDPTEHHEVNEDHLEAFAKNIKELVRSRLAKEDDNRAVLRFSNLGRPDRQLWYMAREKGEDFLPKTLLKFLYGDVIEQLMIFLVKEAGHTVEHEQMELEVDGVKGHIDCVIDGVTTDVKSASPQAFQKFERGTLFENDGFGYIGQISSYASRVTPDTGGAFLAFDKVHGSIAVLSIGSSICNGFDVPSRVKHLKEIIASETQPEKCYSDVEEGKSGNRKLSTNCGYCRFRESCWSDANEGKGLRTFLYSNGPRFLTKVVKTPDVPEVNGRS
jgi:hypothetical protein